jgi:hypothetical protein
MAFIYNLADTWNDAGVTYTSIKMNVLDTASNAASLLMDLQVGGSSRMSLIKTGELRIGTPTTYENRFTTTGAIAAYYNNGLRSSLSMQAGLGFDVVFTFGAANANFTFGSAGSFVSLAVDAANTLAQRNGVNAQTSRIYNTYTDASNYERGKISWSSNVLQIGTEKAGTGTARALEFQTDGTTRFSVTSNLNEIIFNGSGRVSRQSSFGGLVFNADNSITIGVSTVPVTIASFIQVSEQTAPAAPAANDVRIYAEDNGSGKTRLMARFATGAAVQIAIEP